MTAAEVAARVAAFIAAPDAARFDETARLVFAYQYAYNAPYRRFCEGRGVSPEGVRTAAEVPAAPAGAFKRLALTCVPEEACTPERGGRVFHSSGTTGGETSRHFLGAGALDLYRRSLRAGFGRFVLPDGARLPVLALMPPPHLAPHSSLSFMLGELVEEYGGTFFAGDGWLDLFATTLRNLRGPVVAFGTAFAWVHFFDAISERFALPPGSRVVETGGFKGRSREVSRDELYALFTDRLGVPPALCLSEYGMSEMASQFYDSVLCDRAHGLDRAPRKAAPPWLRTRVLDPVTGRDAAPGVPGLLVHTDLANLNSVVTIQTEDWGIAAEDGDGFVLLGRAPGAALRGCSLAAEEFVR